MKSLKAFIKKHCPPPIALCNFINVRKKSCSHNTLNILSCVRQKSCVNIRGVHNRVLIENNCSIHKLNIQINGSGNTVHIASGCYLADCTIWIEDDNNTVFIDESTLLCGSIKLSCIEGTSIHIGKNGLFSSEIELRTGDGHALLNENGERINPSKDITVEDHVWVGAKATILKGAYIKTGSMIAMHAVVTKPIEQSDVVLAGIPARIVKTNIDWHFDRQAGTNS